MVQKIPPPPFFSGPEWQAFNRWLIELTSILSNEGGIDPNQVTGLPALFIEVTGNTSDIAALQTAQGGQATQIAAIQTHLTTIDNEITTINGQITALGARGEILNGVVDPAAGLGKVNDWYANTAGAAGHRIFVKTGVATWTAFPF